MRTKDIKWEDSHSGNIETKFGKIDGVAMFTMSRFNNLAFPDENWVMVSYVIPMNMMKHKDPHVLEIKAYEELDTFIKNITTTKT
jgi:hypothetical protein